MPRVSGRRPADKEKGFIWIPRGKDVVSSLKIDGSTVTDFFTAEFTRSICPEVGSFKIDLINASGDYTELYDIGDSVSFYIDLDGSGPTKRFEGKIDTIQNVFDQRGFVLKLEGGHVSSNDLLNRFVTKSYTGDKTCDEIFKELVDDYLTGYTYTNILPSTVSPTLNWNRKKFWDCIEDLNLQAKTGSRFDAYCDDDKDFYFFEQKTIHNSAEAIVWNDTMISTSGLGLQSVDTKNFIQVVGEDDSGLPILGTSQDSISQAAYDLKEEYIVDNAITTTIQASELASANLSLKKTPETEGRAVSIMLPSLGPGQTIYISDPTMKILDKYKISKYTQKFPIQNTECVIYKKKTVPQLFKDRMQKELALEPVSNQYGMTSSINLTFDDLSELSSYDSNVTVSDGKLLLSSGTEGTATSLTHSQSSNISQVHLLVVGEQYLSAIFSLSTDGGSNYDVITPDQLNNITSGDEVILKIKLKSATTQIDSIALLIN